MTPRAILNTILGFLFLFVLATAGFAVHSYRNMAEKAAKIPELEAKVKTLSEGYALLSSETIRRAEFDRALRDHRGDVSKSLDKVTNEDPVARDYLGERIPDGVRNAVLHPVR